MTTFRGLAINLFFISDVFSNVSNLLSSLELDIFLCPLKEKSDAKLQTEPNGIAETFNNHFLNTVKKLAKAFSVVPIDCSFQEASDL